MKFRARLTMSFEYEEDIDDYEGITPQDVINQTLGNLECGVLTPFDFYQEGEIIYTIKRVPYRRERKRASKYEGYNKDSSQKSRTGLK